VAAGFGYAGDDVTLLRSNGSVQGVPFAATAKEGSWRLLEQLGFDFGNLPVHERLDGIRARYVLGDQKFHREPLPLHWFIMLKRQTDTAASLNRLKAYDALEAIMEESFSPTRRASVKCMQVLIDMLSKTECYELHYSDLGQAVSMLSDLTSNG
jgi:hypothetical protein